MKKTGRLDSPRLIATMGDLTPYSRYELWSTIMDNFPEDEQKGVRYEQRN